MPISDGIAGWGADEADADSAARLAEALPPLTKCTPGHQALELVELEQALRRALSHDELELHYQPQLDLRTGDILSMEALIRWRRPGVGLLMPGEFMPLAEERGLIAQIGEWTIATAAAQAMQWDRVGLAPFGVAINVSASQFHHVGFVDRLEHILHTCFLSPQRLELEVTEAVLMRDGDATLDILRRLHELGVSLSIDEFGTGYSSLSYLRRFPLDEIKIDRTFVNEMMSDEGTARVVRGIIELAHSLGLQVVAEGVETSAQLKRLLDVRCDRAQGHLVSRPVPAAQLARFLDEWPRRWHTMIG